MKKLCTFVVLVSSVSLVAGPLYAHHGRGQTFDMQTEVTLKGAITEVFWRNPHVVFYMDAVDEGGNIVNWGFENANASRLARLGYNRNTLRIGQEITAIVNPARSGAALAVTVEIILQDGSIILSRRRGANPVD